MCKPPFVWFSCPVYKKKKKKATTTATTTNNARERGPASVLLVAFCHGNWSELRPPLVEAIQH